jgi:adenylate cyclase
MNRIERRRLFDTAALGVTLTLLVLLLDRLGAFRHLDDWAYDRRVRSCQYWAPPPSDRIVHLDVDDRALEVIGRWPWPRARLAELLEEVHLAGPKVVALDVMLSEPEQSGPASEGEDEPSAESSVSPGDVRLAAALRRLGNVVSPVVFIARDPDELQPLNRAIRTLWADGLEWSEPDFASKLAGQGFASRDDRAQIESRFIATRREATFDRVRMALAARSDTTPDELTRQLLRGAVAELDSPLKKLLREQFDRALRERELVRFSAAPAAGATAVLEMAGVAAAPLPDFNRRVAAAGFVDSRFLDSKVTRSLPLFVRYDGRLYPQFALVVACRMLDVDVKTLRITEDAVVIPRPDGSAVRIPVRTQHWDSAKTDVPLMMDLPYFGRTFWATAFDWPRHVHKKQHLSMNAVWDGLVTQRRIRANNVGIDTNVKFMLARLDDEAAIKALEAKAPDPDDAEARVPLVRSLLAREDARGILAAAAGFKPEELDDADRKFVALARVLPLTLDQNALLRSQLASQRADLSAQLHEKAVFIGLTAIGMTLDQVPTSMHELCPGVVVHGAMVNAILTNHFWRAAPAWAGPAAILILGLLTTAAAAWLSPWRAAAAALLLLVGYLLFNGLLVFGRWNVLLNAGGPSIVIIAVWSSCALASALIETSERAHVERRFRNYVDPSLVEYVIERADLAWLEGEKRDVTSCFSDIAGFTAISERLGTRTIPLLNEYWETMIPIIRRNRGFIGKFMGDGLFFIFGVPRPTTTHAADAVAAVLEMQSALQAFNQRTAERGLPALAFRAGISTGTAIVGDAGTRQAADYTALGDVTNLGSRLEGANKPFGTCNLLSQRSADDCAGRFLLRRIATLQVVGRATPVVAYEALCPTADATSAQHRLVELTAALVDAYAAARFADCICAADRMTAELGPTKLACFYHELSTKRERERAAGTLESFDGSIRLTEK